MTNPLVQKENPPLLFIPNPPNKAEVKVNLARLIAIGLSTNNIKKLEEELEESGFSIVLTLLNMNHSLFVKEFVSHYQANKVPDFKFEIFQSNQSKDDNFNAIYNHFEQKGWVDETSWSILYPITIDVMDTNRIHLYNIEARLAIYLAGDKEVENKNFILNDNAFLSIM